MRESDSLGRYEERPPTTDPEIMPPKRPIPLPSAPVAKGSAISLWFALLLGLFLGLALVKFGNPIILEHLITQSPEKLMKMDPGFSANPDTLNPPDTAFDLSEWIYRPWPLSWGLWMIGALALVTIRIGHWKTHTPRWLLILPLIWLLWQFVSACSTVNPSLTRVTLCHFTACVVCFFIGWYGLTQDRRAVAIWGGLLIGLCLVFWNGFNQHYGGLEAMRKSIYEQPNWRQFSPDFLKRLGSDRIYSSFIYPNAFAGAILLLLPPSLAVLWRVSQGLSSVYRGVIVGLFGYTGIACLVWSGSKAGWLIALLSGFMVLFSLPLRRQTQWLVLCAILIAGLAGFFIRYSGYFKRGATSVSARFDYWRAAVITAKTHPVLGTGPGTFSVPYKLIKAPESEMARLTHNDYLEQASDSGIPGFLAYLCFILGSLAYLYRQSYIIMDPIRFSVWLGLLSWAVQSFVEFVLYIPAIAWPSFTLLGWLLAAPGNPIDKTGSQSYAH